MSFSCYKVLWILLHFIVNVLEALFYFGLEFRDKISNFTKNFNQSPIRHEKADERQLIESHLHELTKLPKHLGVILNASSENDVDLKKLASLLSWALGTGINVISFYDYRGIVKNQLSTSFSKAIQQNQVDKRDNENIVWGPDYQTPSKEGIKYPHRNGYKRHIVVNLYSSDDGQTKFTELLKQGLHKDIDSKEITIDYVEEHLSKLYGQMPDPDLAVYFGSSCCTAGFLPWQIRLTEFIQISFKLQSLSLEKYLRVLYKFAKCEQRFGK